MNNLVNILPTTTYIKYCIAIILFISCSNIEAQDLKGKYVLGGISVVGNTSFSEQTIITYSGLSKGKEISIPGEEISSAIKKLWNSKLFNDIEVYVSKVEDDVAFLEIRLSDLPQINEVKVNGVKKSEQEKVIKENVLNRGVKVTENLITNTKNFLEKKYKKNGFVNTKVYINAIDVKDSLETARVNLLVNICIIETIGCN